MNPEPALDAAWHAEWDRYYTGLVRRCEPLIAAEMGRELPEPVQNIAAFSRAEWVDANIVSFQKLFAPLERMHQDSSNVKDLGTLLMTDLNQTVLSGELGVLLGYLARRVLGQYDLSLLGREPISVGRLYMVEPNIAGVQQERGLDHDDFRLWIALHETTHAFQFEAYPWVREYFNTILESYFNLIIEDLSLLRNASGGLSSLVPAGALEFRLRRKLDRDGHVAGTARVVQQASGAHVDHRRLQQLHHECGRRRGSCRHYEYIKQRIEERAAQRSPIEKLFVRLTGLALKMEQYRRGEAFINAVVAERGVKVANLVWAGPEYLPTLDELKNHHDWIARVDRLVAAGSDQPTRPLDETILRVDGV